MKNEAPTNIHLSFTFFFPFFPVTYGLLRSLQLITATMHLNWDISSLQYCTQLRRHKSDTKMHNELTKKERNEFTGTTLKTVLFSFLDSSEKNLFLSMSWDFFNRSNCFRLACCCCYCCCCCYAYGLHLDAKNAYMKSVRRFDSAWSSIMTENEGGTDAWRDR